MTVDHIHADSDKARERNAGTMYDWSVKDYSKLKVVRWVHRETPNHVKLTRAVIDVSNHQYPLFVSLDKHFHAAIEKDAAKLPRILLQRRFFELRHLNELLDFLRTHFVFLAEILAVYDHPYNRRKTKLDQKAARQIRTAKFAVSENVRAAILKYHEEKGTDGARIFPQVEIENDGIQFPAFHPPTESELILPANPSEIQIKIHHEAVKLAHFTSQLVANTEADSVCRNASLGVYHSGPTNDFPLHHFRFARGTEPSHIFERDSIIVGNDSDHSSLNDDMSAKFILGLSSARYPSRATNLTKRFLHPSDWDFVNRFASTLAMGFAGCDDTRGLPGHTLPSIARAGRFIRNPTKLDEANREILEFVNDGGRLIEAYKRGQVRIDYADGSSKLWTWSEYEEAVNDWIGEMFKATPTHQVCTVTASSLVEVYLGLVEDKGAVESKRESEKVARESLTAVVNSELEFLYTKHGRHHNHFFSSFISAPHSDRSASRESPPNSQLPYRVRKGPSSRALIQDQEAESRKLVERQGQDPEDEAPVDRRKKGKGQKQVVAVKTKPKAPPVGAGLRHFKLAMSSLPLPFGISIVRNLIYPGIPQGQQFHYAFPAVLESILNLWLNDGPGIVEILNAVNSLYFEFAPSLLTDWSSGGQKFGERAKAVVTSCCEYYKKFELKSDGPDSLKFSSRNHDQSLPQWLARRVAEAEQHVPPDRRNAFRQEVHRYGFEKEDFHVFSNDYIDLFVIMAIKERRRLRYPPPLLRHSLFIAQNMTICGTGYMNASQSRSKIMPAFIATNLTDTLLDFPERIGANPYKISTDRVDRALATVLGLPPTTLQQLLPHARSRGVKRLIKVRIHTSHLPDASNVELRIPPPSFEPPSPGQVDEDEMVLMFDYGVDDDEEGEEYEWERDSEEEGDTAMEVDDSFSLPPLRPFQEHLEEAIRRSANRSPDSGTSTDFLDAIRALAELIDAQIDFLVTFVGLSYLEAISTLAKGLELEIFETIGEMVVALGGKEVKLKPNERFLDAGGGRNVPTTEERREVDEEVVSNVEGEEDEDSEERNSVLKSAMRGMTIQLLPLFGRTLFRFKPRGCTIDVPTVQAFTSSRANNDSYLPPLVQALQERQAQEARSFNQICVRLGLTVDNFTIPDYSNLAADDPKRMVYVELERLSKVDPFIKDQIAHPDKILFPSLNCWPHLELAEEACDGPLPVRLPTLESQKLVEDQTKTVEALFKHMGLNQTDLTQLGHELMNLFFKVDVGKRAGVGKFYFNREELIPLLVDFRHFLPQGARHFDKLQETDPKLAFEELISSHPRMTQVYDKLEKKRIKTQSSNLFNVSFGEELRSATGTHQVERVASVVPIFRPEKVNGTTTLRFSDPSQAPSSRPVLDDRKGLYLPFSTPLSTTGVATLRKWKDWMRIHMSSTESPSGNSSPPLPVPRTRKRALSQPLPTISSAPSSLPYAPSVTTRPALQPTQPPLRQQKPPPVLPASRPVHNLPRSSVASRTAASHADLGSSPTAALPSSSSTTASPQASTSRAAVPPVPQQQSGGGGVATMQPAPETSRQKAYLISSDAGRRILVDAAIISNDDENIRFVRMSSGKSIERDKEVQKRANQLLRFEGRSRLARGFQKLTGQDTTDLALLLRRPRTIDPANPGRYLPESRVSFESQLLWVPPPIQPALVHNPGYLLSKMNAFEQQRRRSLLDQEARRRWNDLIPEPADGSKVAVAFVRAFNSISGGKGYGRNAAQGVEDAEIRTLRSMPWVDLVVVRSTEAFSSKVCAKPGCGASLIHPCRLGDPTYSDILRLVVCLRCLRVGHRDDNGALNVGRIAMARGQGVKGNLLSPANAKLLNSLYRGTNAQVRKLKNRLKVYLGGLTEVDRKARIENLKRGESLLELLQIAAGNDDIDEEDDADAEDEDDDEDEV